MKACAVIVQTRASKVHDKKSATSRANDGVIIVVPSLGPRDQYESRAAASSTSTSNPNNHPKSARLFHLQARRSPQGSKRAGVVVFELPYSFFTGPTRSHQCGD